MPRVRVHQHVNPLSPFYRQAPEPLRLSSVFADASKPILLDIGCARGRFLLRMAELDVSRNYLGVEIREPLVDEANRLAAEAGLANLHYAFCNAMLWLEKLIEDIPVGLIDIVTIQFPDPWFKKKHAKRRMVTPELVQAVADKLSPGGRIFVQTDIEFLAEEMFGMFRENRGLSEIPVEAVPFTVKTERENAVEAKGLPVYRAMFEKPATSNSSLS
jgi:tRNA (guanine-N7-)-methyltransferase